LDLRLDVLDGVVGFDVQSDRFPREGLDEDLHGTTTKTKHEMEGGLLLNVVVGERSSVFKLFSCKDQTLLLWRNAFFVLDLRLDVLDGVVGFDVQSDRFPREGLDEDLHGTTAKTKDKVEGGLLLNVVVREGSSIFKLLSCKDQTLLLWRDAFLVLNLRLDVLDGVVGFDVQGNRLSREGLDENLHGTTTKTEDEMEGGLLLNVIIRERSSILKLLSREDQSLLLRWDALLVLDLGLHVLNRVVRLDIQGNGFPREGLDEDLHRTTAKTKDKMESGLFLNVIVRKRSSILKLLSREDQTLLLWWNAFLVLDLRLDVLDGVVGFDVQSDRFSREGLDENLHGTTAKTEDEMEGGLLLNVVVREGSPIFKLLSRKD